MGKRMEAAMSDERTADEHTHHCLPRRGAHATLSSARALSPVSSDED